MCRQRRTPSTPVSNMCKRFWILGFRFPQIITTNSTNAAQTSTQRIVELTIRHTTTEMNHTHATCIANHCNSPLIFLMLISLWFRPSEDEEKEELGNPISTGRSYEVYDQQTQNSSAISAPDNLYISGHALGHLRNRLIRLESPVKSGKLANNWSYQCKNH